MQSSQATASASTGGPASSGEACRVGFPGEAVGERLVSLAEDVHGEDRPRELEELVGAMLVVDDDRDERRVRRDRDESRDRQAVDLPSRLQETP